MITANFPILYVAIQYVVVGNVLINIIPLFSVDANTLSVGAIVGVAFLALADLTIVAVAVFARWWKKEDSGTLDLTTDVSMECTMQTPYCVLQEFLSIWHKMLSKTCI